MPKKKEYAITVKAILASDPHFETSLEAETTPFYKELDKFVKKMLGQRKYHVVEYDVDDIEEMDNNVFDPNKRKVKRKFRMYTIKIRFDKLIKKWNKLKKARLFFTTTSKRVPIQKKDIVGLIFYTKKAYDKAKKILAR